MKNPTASLSVCVLQTSAVPNVARNLAALDQTLAAAARADLIVLPEVFAVRGSDATLRGAAEDLKGGHTVAWLRAWARRKKAWFLGGSVLEKAGGKIYNTSVLLDPAGRIRATYRKLHLFEAQLNTRQWIRESDVYAAGSRPVLTTIKGWRCGLAICYDLRFSELFRHYAARGADLVCIPSNFTQNTGRAHWSTLVRARAIENQCYVIAPNQCGINRETGIRSYGHSLIVGPWGKALCSAGRTQQTLTARLHTSRLAEIRARIPVLSHRRFAPARLQSKRETGRAIQHADMS